MTPILTLSKNLVFAGGEGRERLDRDEQAEQDAEEDHQEAEGVGVPGGRLKEVLLERLAALQEREHEEHGQRAGHRAELDLGVQGQHQRGGVGGGRGRV